VNRVIARLRRTAEGIGEGAFAIDTITRVGYRLRLLDDAAVELLDGPAARPSRVGRRELLVAGAAVAGAAGLGGAWFLTHRDAGGGERAEPESPAIAALMDQANLALRQGTREGQTQAIGLYRQVVADAPAYADGWGALGLSYAFIAHYRTMAEGSFLHQQASAAGKRAESLDPGNVLGKVALATARPTMGNWGTIETPLFGAVQQYARNEQLLFTLQGLLGSTGRMRDALVFADRLAVIAPPTPVYIYMRSWNLWSAGRLEEADALLANASRLYPTHFAIWFSRFYILMFTGRAEAAVALAADTDSLPSGIPEEEIAAVVRVAKAMVSRDPAAIDGAMKQQVERAHLAAGSAENAFQFAAAFGRFDECFRIMDAYYFAEGFDPGELRFTRSQGTYTPRNDRLTGLLFNPVMAEVRRDPRFAALTRRLGLADYWRTAGKLPDYLGSL
jgi:tetratricopeptide (TPR) repeat protein